MKLERFVFGLGFVIVSVTFLFFATTAQGSSIQAKSSQNTNETGSDSVISSKKLVFSDEFDGTTLNSKKWATCYDWRKPSETGCSNQGNSEQEWYADNQLKVSDGQLIISAEKSAVDAALQNQVKSFDYRSGMVNSGRGSTNGAIRWAGTYGYYEARLKFQKGQGVWPAFWLLPIDKSWPPEIDVMEFTGNKPTEILQTVHWQEDGKPMKSVVVVNGKTDYSNDWHTYGVDWRPDGIDWYIDGKKTRSYSGPNVPDKPMEIVLNLAIGGLLPGNADETTPFPSELRVDYVRVYQSQNLIRPQHY